MLHDVEMRRTAATSKRSRFAAVVVAVAIAATGAVGASPADARRLPPRPSLSLSNATAGESVGAISFPVTLSAPAARDIRVWAFTLRGSAKPGRDFRPGLYSAVIPTGFTTGRIDVPIVNDDVAEADKSFKLIALPSLQAKLSAPNATGTIRDDDTPLPVNVLHINDHHSNLQPTVNALNLGTSGGSFNVPFGGFPQVAAKISELESQLDNVVKIHAGDAITGTLFYSLFKGQADADLMNSVCFDLFELGNHEFDDGDEVLRNFLDALNADPNCDTTTLAANVVPQVGTPLAPTTPNDYVKPYAIREFDGQPVGFIGIDVANKTRFSSQPFETTQFLDEVETAQRYVDELGGLGINNIVLVTHYGYDNDLALASAVSGVDAIVGGDSHTLLGDFAGNGLPSAGAYPTVATNADGAPVCVVQAWQYSWVVGELGVTFNDGRAASCTGTPHLLLGDAFTRTVANVVTPVAEPERSAILAAIDADPQLSIVAPDPGAAAALAFYSGQVTELSKQVIGTSGEVLCERRVPTVPRGIAPCNGNALALNGAQLGVNGGFSQQVVSDAFLARAFRADFAIQNGGGVRIAIPAGPITIATAYTLLPFSNTLVELDLTGQEVLNSIEDGLAFYASNPGGNTGAFPYGSHIRWDIDMKQARGLRASNVEVKDRVSGAWAPLDVAGQYTVVTNSFMAGGGDGYATFKVARDAGRFTDTFINYAQGFIDYVVEDLGGGTLVAPLASEFSTRSFIPL